MKRKTTRLQIPEGVESMTASEYQAMITPAPIKPSKYHSILTNVDGLQFASRKEAKRYVELRHMQNQGLIKSFDRQVSYILLESVKGLFRKKSYKADFVITYADGRVEVEDVKGVKTDVYQMKKHLMFSKYNILIKEY
jgi:hypothetical protein